MTDQQPIDQDAVKLAPCPFCGGEARYSVEGFMFCGCGAAGPVAPIEGEPGMARRDAIAAWNRRASPPVREGEGFGSSADADTHRGADRAVLGNDQPIVVAFAGFIDAIKRAPISWETGVCCCGNAVADHGFGDGHSPVDEGLHFVSGAIRDAEEALTAASVSPGMSEANAPTPLVDRLVDGLNDAAQGRYTVRKVTAHPPQGEAEMREALERIAHVMSEMVGTPVDTEAANAWAMALQAVTDIALAALTGRGKGDE